MAICLFCKLRPIKPSSDTQASQHILPSCVTCTRHAITNTTQLDRVAVWVLQHIEKLGINFERRTTQIRLLSDSVFVQRTGSAQISGLAICHFSIDVLGLRKHNYAEVLIRYGVPVAHLIWILSHELGHVIASQNNYHFRDCAHEEAFCQLLAYLVIHNSHNPQSKEVIAQEWHNPDPIYGEGLRQAYKECNAIGITAYLQSHKIR
jgi:hypothetical protein